jgi:hypothetical protein
MSQGIEETKPVDFDVMKENWSIYELEDDAAIRIKIVLTDLEETNQAGGKPNKLGFGARLLSTVFSPTAIKGEKGGVWNLKELEAAIIQSNLKFRLIKDGGPSEYETSKAKITIRHILRSVDKTSKFDQRGNPAYIIHGDSDILVESKPAKKE